jgi:Signal peptidase, peptidase S26
MKSMAVIFAIMVSATVQAQQVAPTFSRGEQVRVRSLDPNRAPATTMTLVVVAVPNDRLSVLGTTLLVNGTPVMSLSPDFVARMAGSPERIPSQVPDGHYFVIGEQRVNQNISEYWGQHAAASLQSAR